VSTGLSTNDFLGRARLSRRHLLSAVLAASCFAASDALAMHPGVSVGAIRWDPWYEPKDDGERAVVERTLGPDAFRGRAPSCAMANGRDGVTFQACDTQARMDAEIGAAHQAGLDYWAYCWYGATSPMQEAWRLHQSSSTRRDMNWCLLFSSYHLFETEVGSLASMHALDAYLAQENYQRVSVAGLSRPLVYLLDNGKGEDGIAQAVAACRTACSAAGRGNPYIVLLGRPSMQAGSIAATGADAVGAYAFGRPADRSPYAALAEAGQAHWASIAAAGQSMVPTAMTGWDRRPRMEHPVPWEASNSPDSLRLTNFYQSGSPAQIASHVAAMLAWIRSNRTACPAQTGLIYSWDEHDEGGSTLNPSVSQGGAILAAVRRIL
jgi:hypothetical protein